MTFEELTVIDEYDNTPQLLYEHVNMDVVVSFIADILTRKPTFSPPASSSSASPSQLSSFYLESLKAVALKSLHRHTHRCCLPPPPCDYRSLQQQTLARVCVCVCVCVLISTSQFARVGASLSRPSQRQHHASATQSRPHS